MKQSREIATSLPLIAMATVVTSSPNIYDAEELPDELFKRVSSHFTESEIVNLTLIIGLMNVFNRFNGALGVGLEKVSG